MDWSNQTGEFSKIWATVQQRLWEQWYDLTQQNVSKSSAVYDQWQQIATNNFESWTNTADETLRGTAEQVISSQKTMMNFWEFATNSWQDIYAKMDAGEDWQQTLQSYTEKMREQFTQSTGAALQASQEFGAMWQINQEKTQKMTETWLTFWQQPPVPFGPTMEGKTTFLSDLNKLYGSVYEQTMLPFLHSPIMKLTHELENKMRKGFVLWQEYWAAEYNYQMQFVDVWISTFEQIQNEITTLTKKGEMITSLEELRTLWVKSVEREFGELLASDTYVETQGTMLNALMSFCVFQREMMEFTLQQLSLPNLSEVGGDAEPSEQKAPSTPAAGDDPDQIQQAITTLKKEIAALKQQLSFAEKASNKANIQSRQTIQALKQEIEALKRLK